MFDEVLDERVEVIAEFKKGFNPCVPVSFRRKNGVEVVVTELGLRHPKYDGVKTRHAFDVTDGGSDYRLEFDTVSLVWKLTWMGDRYDGV